MALQEENYAFTGRPETHRFAGILFDMDGTIVDSTDAIVKHWHKSVSGPCWASQELQSVTLTFPRIGKEMGVDPLVILQTSHGRRSIDTFQLYDPST